MPIPYRQNQSISLEAARVLERKIRNLRKRNAIQNRQLESARLTVRKAYAKLRAFEQVLWLTFATAIGVFSVGNALQTSDESAPANYSGAGGAADDQETPQELPICPVTPETAALNAKFRATLENAFGTHTECIALWLPSFSAP